MTVETKPLKVFGSPVDEKALAQIENVMRDERAVAGALMADHHLGYSMPIGGVVAYQDAISPTGVGFDIACGNKAVRTELRVGSLPVWHDLGALMRKIQKTVAFGMGRSNPTPIDHGLFDDEVWPELERLSPGLKAKAAAQLGTVGSGNHYVDLLHDEHGFVWIANHFGSRGLGHTIASGFMALHAGREFHERVPETEEAVVLDTGTHTGDFYVTAMQLAGRYAYAGRDYVIDQVLELLGNPQVDLGVHNHHNYAWHEDGHWIVRKGATPLTHEPAYIGGSMGDGAIIVRGLVEPLIAGGVAQLPVVDVGALGSAPHGAGRVMSRTAAAGKLRKMWVCTNRDCGHVERAFALGDPNYKVAADTACPHGHGQLSKRRVRDVSTAAIDWDAARADLEQAGIVVLGAGADESPGVYKNLDEVIGSHPNIEVLHRLTPLGVVMAGPDEYDPYKD